jgi:hypothetical protein
MATEDRDWQASEAMALRYTLAQLRRQDVDFGFENPELVISVLAELYIATMMRERVIGSLSPGISVPSTRACPRRRLRAPRCESPQRRRSRLPSRTRC